MFGSTNFSINSLFISSAIKCLSGELYFLDLVATRLQSLVRLEEHLEEKTEKVANQQTFNGSFSCNKIYINALLLFHKVLSIDLINT